MINQREFEDWAKMQGFNVDKNEYGQYYNHIIALMYSSWVEAFMRGNERVLNALKKQDIDPSFKNRILTQLAMEK